MGELLVVYVCRLIKDKEEEYLNTSITKYRY